MLLNLIKYLDVLMYVFLGVWLLLLVLCCLRKEFYPIFASSKSTRKFWLITFVFVNPLLVLLYLIFG